MQTLQHTCKYLQRKQISDRIWDGRLLVRCVLLFCWSRGGLCQSSDAEQEVVRFEVIFPGPRIERGRIQLPHSPAQPHPIHSRTPNCRPQQFEIHPHELTHPGSNPAPFNLSTLASTTIFHTDPCLASRWTAT